MEDERFDQIIYDKLYDYHDTRADEDAFEKFNKRMVNRVWNMSQIFFDSGVSLDGFLAGQNTGPDNPLGDGGNYIHYWMYPQRAFLESVGIDGAGGQEGIENRLVKETLKRTGAHIMGKRMFDEGEKNWPENLFKADVFVLTHERREPFTQKNGATFYFINDGIESALRQALLSADGKDVRIQGGASVIRQYLNAGLVNDFIIHTAPVILGNGIRLFEDIDRDRFDVRVVDMVQSRLSTHIRYKLDNKS